MDMASNSQFSRSDSSLAEQQFDAKRRTEWEIVQQALAGNSDALTILFGSQEKLFHSAYSVLRNKEDAEDALQDALLSAFVKLRGFQGRSRFSTWLTRIVFNAALINRRRSNNRPKVLSEPLEEDDPRLSDNQIHGEYGNPEEIFNEIETRHMLEQAMSQLSPRLRSALYLRDIQGFSIREAAKQERVTAGVLKARSFRARHQLANSLR